MSLKTSYGTFNFYEPNKRVTTYSATPTVKLVGVEMKPIYWTLKRISSYSYRYFGMTEAAAEACRDDLIEEYTRRKSAWQARVEDGEGGVPVVKIDPVYETVCTAQIAVTKESGSAWAVEVSENDSDTVISLDEPQTIEDFERYFADAETRDRRRKGESYITILSANWLSEEKLSSLLPKGVIRGTFEQNAAGTISVQVFQNGSWVTLPSSSVIINLSDGEFEFASEDNCIFRLAGTHPAYSQTWTTNDYPTPAITIVSATYDLVNRVYSESQTLGSLNVDNSPSTVMNLVVNWSATNIYKLGIEDPANANAFVTLANGWSGRFGAVSTVRNLDGTFTSTFACNIKTDIKQAGYQATVSINNLAAGVASPSRTAYRNEPYILINSVTNITTNEDDEMEADISCSSSVPSIQQSVVGIFRQPFGTAARISNFANDGNGFSAHIAMPIIPGAKDISPAFDGRVYLYAKAAFSPDLVATAPYFIVNYSPVNIAFKVISHEMIDDETVRVAFTWFGRVARINTGTDVYYTAGEGWWKGSNKTFGKDDFGNDTITANIRGYNRFRLCFQDVSKFYYSEIVPNIPPNANA